MITPFLTRSPSPIIQFDQFTRGLEGVSISVICALVANESDEGKKRPPDIARRRPGLLQRLSRRRSVSSYAQLYTLNPRVNMYRQ
jgi:hypothetical protein